MLQLKLRAVDKQLQEQKDADAGGAPSEAALPDDKAEAFDEYMESSQLT